MTKRKFYKTVFTVEILSEEEPCSPSLGTIAFQITKGDWSGTTREKSKKKLDGRQAARALFNQGSDPSFFRLTDEGEDDG
jgi:hypothetical protein